MKGASVQTNSVHLHSVQITVVDFATTRNVIQSVWNCPAIPCSVNPLEPGAPAVLQVRVCEQHGSLLPSVSSA